MILCKVSFSHVRSLIRLSSLATAYAKAKSIASCGVVDSMETMPPPQLPTLGLGLGDLFWGGRGICCGYCRCIVFGFYPS